MKYFCGLDFGTSNTAISVLRTEGHGNSIKDIKVVTVEPSVIFYPKQRVVDDIYHVGNEAIENYMKHKMEGRFIKSIKTLLPDTSFDHTIINTRPYVLDDILSGILKYFKTKAESYVGDKIESVYMGRPVYFSSNKNEDKIAEKRLLNAAWRAGFKERKLLYEPVAAAFAYSMKIDEPKTVFVADLGGGTSDFNLINIKPVGSGDENNTEIISVDGVRVGGDDFDSDIMSKKVIKYLGYGSKFNSLGKWLEMPVHIYTVLRRWEHLHLLDNLKIYEQLREIKSSSDYREAIVKLERLLKDKLAYFLFKAIESSKIELSSNDKTQILYKHKEIDLDIPLKIETFNRMIRDRVSLIFQTIDTILEGSGIGVHDISAVILNGGTSEVNMIKNMFIEKFGDKILQIDIFTGVSMGLAIAAWKNFQY